MADKEDSSLLPGLPGSQLPGDTGAFLDPAPFSCLCPLRLGHSSSCLLLEDSSFRSRPKASGNLQAMVLAEPLLLAPPWGRGSLRVPPAGSGCALFISSSSEGLGKCPVADSQHELGLASPPPHHSRRPQASIPSSRCPPRLSLCARAFPSHFTDTAWQVPPTVSQAPNPTDDLQPSLPRPPPGV